MTDNTQRFTGRAEDYDRYRQRYPAAAILNRLRVWCGLASSWLVADVGAGTGMLAEIFLDNGNRVVAVEPNADMRDRMHQIFATRASTVSQPQVVRSAASQLKSIDPAASQLQIIDAAAEATTLAPASLDMVAAGRAFHWFDKDRALAEFRRILKPEGWIVLVSQGRAHQVTDLAPQDRTAGFTSQIDDFEHLLMEHGTDYKGLRARYRVHDNLSSLFGSSLGPGAEIHQAEIPGTQQLDWETLRGQTLSLSVVPPPDHPGYPVFQRELRRYFDAHAIAGILTTPTVCHLTAARYLAP